MMEAIWPGETRKFSSWKFATNITIQGDLFSQSIREGTELAVPLEGSLKNMAVIEAVFRSADSGKWEMP